MKRALSLIALTPALALAGGMHEGSMHEGGHGHEEAAAYGEPGDPARVTRTVIVEAADSMRYQPEVIAVKRGETVKFILKNTGKLSHEFVLGDESSRQGARPKASAQIPGHWSTPTPIWRKWGLAKPAHWSGSSARAESCSSPVWNPGITKPA